MAGEPSLSAATPAEGARPLSVLHINTADAQGGAARSAYKIHRGLCALGVRSRMLVRTRDRDDPEIARLRGTWPERLGDALGRELLDRLGAQYVLHPSSMALPGHAWFQDADVVQLYNLHGGYFGFRALPALSAQRPLVWRLSDMWPFTGHCSYSHECERWREGCGACPHLDEYPPLPIDTSAWLWRLKRRAYASCALEVVVTNRWMEARVRESPLLGRFPLHRVPNGVDTSVYAPRARQQGRRELELAEEDRAVLFAAHVARPFTRKGGEHVIPTLERVAARVTGELVLVVVGEGAGAWPEGRGYRTRRIGFTSDDARLASYYAAADVTLSPARAENFPNTVLESMACATPAAVFEAGGVGDAVRHLETGWLAPPDDVEALAEGTARILSEAGLAERLGATARSVVEAEFTLERQAAAFRDLYARILARGA